MLLVLENAILNVYCRVCYHVDMGQAEHSRAGVNK
jgi:hypothetical protein